MSIYWISGGQKVPAATLPEPLREELAENREDQDLLRVTCPLHVALDLLLGVVESGIDRLLT